MSMRSLLMLALVVVAAACLAAPRGAHGAGECGKVPADKMVLKLTPFASAGQDTKSAPSSGYCTTVHTISKQSPKCLCAIMLSDTAKSTGIKREVAMSIAKRCNLVDRPVGYKCRELQVSEAY